MPNKINIYGVGGCGANIASRYIDTPNNNVNMATLVPMVVDTSQSNLRNIDTDKIGHYLIPDLDGSGKVRRENHRAIAKTVKEMLHTMPPEQFNVVVFSASGGSGSVIGPLLIKELNERGQTAIAIVVGSYESAISADNSRKTLETLESIAENTATPVIMSYHLNEPGVRRTDVDSEIFAAIACLALLMSGEVMEMDTRDLIHWANFSKTGTVSSDPQLATLHILLGNEHLSAYRAPVSVASLMNSPDVPLPSLGADYHTDGYMDLSSIDDVEQIHYIISSDELSEIYKQIASISDQLEESRSARVKRDSIVGRDRDRTDDGMIL